jgi:hypothetical protein
MPPGGPPDGITAAPLFVHLAPENCGSSQPLTVLAPWAEALEEVSREAPKFLAPIPLAVHRPGERELAPQLLRVVYLKAARLDLSATEALTILKSIRVVDIDLGNGTTKRSVTAGTQRAAAVLRAIGITDLDPPTPPISGQTVM